MPKSTTNNVHHIFEKRVLTSEEVEIRVNGMPKTDPFLLVWLDKNDNRYKTRYRGVDGEFVSFLRLALHRLSESIFGG